MQSKQHGATFALYLFKTLIQEDELQRSETLVWYLQYLDYGIIPCIATAKREGKPGMYSVYRYPSPSFTFCIPASLLPVLPSFFSLSDIVGVPQVEESFNLLSHLNYSYIESSPLQIPSFKREIHSGLFATSTIFL